MKTTRKDWLFALGLTTPMALFYIVYYFNHGPSLLPTGFIGYDNVSYIAYAKEYLNSDRFSLFYSNPLNDSGNYPKIYFQVQSLVYALLLYLKMPPGLVIVLFNFAGTFLSFRMVVAIIKHLLPYSDHQRLISVLFCWGGGLLTLAGALVGMFYDLPPMDFLDQLFFLDPASGWWGLNFGRGHFMSSEGFYHFLFLSGIYCILKQKWKTAVAVAILLSLAHPFTGVEYLCIVTGYGFAEKLFFRNRQVPLFFLIAQLGILAFHVWYYLYFLNQHPEHRSVSEQYALNWRLRFFSMIPAYCLVGTLAIVSIIQLRSSFFKQSNNRLFLYWFAIAFLLANHEIFMKPMQPLHFTRGYIWASLFLLGLPALNNLLEQGKKRRRKLILGVVLVLFFADNTLWLINYFRSTSYSTSTAYISPEQKSILQTLDRHSTNQTLLLGKDEVVPYLATVYTKAYPWYTHPFTTPFAERKRKAYADFLAQGTMNPAWQNREIIFVFRKDDEQENTRARQMPVSVVRLTETNHYIILRTIKQP